MVRPTKRRHATVAQTKQFLEAVGYIRGQKQIPNLERISKYMQREYNMGYNTCQRQLELVVEDGFVLEYTTVGFKGQRTGLEQEGYKICSVEDGDYNDVRDGHDWYCFTCHSPGDLLLCSECYRCYHTSCTDQDYAGSKFTCSICKAGKKKNKMKKKMLNTLLSYTILRLREKTKELHKIGSKTDEEDLKRYVYQRMDLSAMEMKVQTSRYKCVEDFYADGQTIEHNCALVYGNLPGGMTELATVMLRDCKYDLDEIELCPNCYYMSNAKPEQWFCQPCNPPHDLVYAKLKGFGYWPAKVINEVEGKMDVRFFGGWHQRAVIPAEYIRPVTTNLNKLTVKRTAGFTKACKELKVHQQLLEERERELQDLNGKEGFQAEEEEDEVEEEEPEEELKEEEVKEDVKVKEVKVKKVKEVKDVKPGETSLAPLSPEVAEGGAVVGGEVEEEVDTRQVVTSTSVDTKRKRKSSSVKVAPPDESFAVTSSEDKVLQPKAVSSKTPIKSSFTSSTHSQTTKTKTHVVGTQTVKSDTQEDKDEEEEEDEPVKKMARLAQRDEVGAVQWQARLDKEKADVSERLKKQHDEDKSKSLKDLTDRLKKDFEEDKQAAVARAMMNVNREIEKSRKQAEDKCKEQYMEEMKKLAAKHKESISQTKKKQWCFNCEEEAMYHCCWNTSYCSVRCQQEHWHKEHKRVCRRKR